MKITADVVLKLVVIFYILYRTCLVEIGFNISGLNYVLWGIAIFLTVLIDRGRIKKYQYISANMLFLAVTTLTGLFIAQDNNISLDISLRLFEALVLGYIVIRLADREKNINVVAYAWILSATILVVYSIFNGSAIRLTGRISVNENFNVNTFGVFLMFAIWFAIYIFSHSYVSIVSIGALVIEIALFSYGVIISGSRKAALGAVAMLFMLVFFVLKPVIRNYSVNRKVVIYIGFIIAVVLFVKIGLPYFGEASQLILKRMGLLFSEGFATESRDVLIKDALRVFGEYPILGVGWNNYRYYSIRGLYSHCTYVELLACCGLVGGFIGLYVLYKYIKESFKMKETIYKDKIQTILLLGFLLYICWGQILYYNVNLLLIMYTVSAVIISVQQEEREE